MFAKIFSSIFDSSIADDWQTRVVFQDMLVLADKDGIVDMTLAAISRRTNIPLEIVTAAIPKLEAEDTASRTPDHSGKRIMRLDAHRDWGWQIVNFVKYRESATKEMLRMAEADRKRVYRARHGGNPSPRPPTQQKQKAEAEADMSIDMSRTSASRGADSGKAGLASVDGLVGGLLAQKSVVIASAPTLAEVQAVMESQFKGGGRFAESWIKSKSAAGWKDEKGQPIHDWKALAKRYASGAEARSRGVTRR